MKRTLVSSLLALVASTAASAECAYEAPRELALDLAGINRVELDLGASELKLRAGEGPSRITGKACSSHEDRLEDIRIEQERRGDTLRIRAVSNARFIGVFFKPTYAHLKLQAELPAGVAIAFEVGSGELAVEGMQRVDVELGSGEAEISGAQQVSLDVGSGEAHIRRVAGEVRVEVGSGDIELEQIGRLTVESVGSGDLMAEGIGGDVSIEDIGSGEVVLRDVEGSVVVEHVGSGELQARAVKGALRVEHVGSGNLIHQDIQGEVELPERD